MNGQQFFCKFNPFDVLTTGKAPIRGNPPPLLCFQSCLFPPSVLQRTHHERSPPNSVRPLLVHLRGRICFFPSSTIGICLQSSTLTRSRDTKPHPPPPWLMPAPLLGPFPLDQFFQNAPETPNFSPQSPWTCVRAPISHSRDQIPPLRFFCCSPLGLARQR